MSEHWGPPDDSDLEARSYAHAHGVGRWLLMGLIGAGVIVGGVALNLALAHVAEAIQRLMAG